MTRRETKKYSVVIDTNPETSRVASGTSTTLVKNTGNIYNCTVLFSLFEEIQTKKQIFFSNCK